MLRHNMRSFIALHFRCTATTAHIYNYCGVEGVCLPLFLCLVVSFIIHFKTNNRIRKVFSMLCFIWFLRSFDKLHSAWDQFINWIRLSIDIILAYATRCGCWWSISVHRFIILAVGLFFCVHPKIEKNPSAWEAQCTDTSMKNSLKIIHDKQGHL